MIKEHLKVAFEYWMYVNMKADYRREKKRQKDLPQFLKPGYKIIDHGSERPEYNWWNNIFHEIETVQIEQNE